jgi:carbon storage regulator
MLVLTRRVGEKLVIGNEVVVEVLAISGEGVRLGIVAPRETSVHRFEVFEEIHSANRAASSVSANASSTTVAQAAERLRARDNQGADKEQGRRQSE